MSRYKIILSIIFLVAIAAIGRLVPHPWNATPIMAATLVAGVYLNRRAALIVPLAATIVSDFFLGFYDWKVMAAVYATYALIALGSILLKRWKSAESIIAAGVVSSTLFFLTTNAAVWFFTPWYAHTAGGLLHAYLMGLPFYRNAVVGDVFFTALFFGAIELYRAQNRWRKPVVDPSVVELV